MKSDFLDAMSKAANTVCVVTTDGQAGRAGVTISAMTSVSVESNLPSLLVCIHNLSPTCQAIRTNKVFCANVLSSVQMAISDRFAGRTEDKGENKFNGCSWSEAETGAPVLRDTVASFDCRLISETLVGSHYIFVGEAATIRSDPEREPLIYFDRAYATAVKMPT